MWARFRPFSGVPVDFLHNRKKILEGELKYLKVLEAKKESIRQDFVQNGMCGEDALRGIKLSIHDAEDELYLVNSELRR